MERNRQIDLFESVSGFYLLVLLAIVLITAFIGDFPIFLVVVGFFPTIFTIVIALVLHEKHITRTGLLWLLPIIIVLGFYLLGKSNTAVLGTMDVDILTGVNFILALLYVLLVASLTRVEVKKTNVHVTREVLKPEESIEDYIHSIEDKSKALNFAVGRVYNKYHGGSPEIREKLKIPVDWYNEFALLGVGTDKIDTEKLTDIITQFEIRLKNYRKTESEIFGSKHEQLKNLIRNPDGSDVIIDVMDHNDKDPVRSYFEGAVLFCKKVKDELARRNLKIVKNTYIPTPEEKEQLEEKHKTAKSDVKLSESPTSHQHTPASKAAIKNKYANAKDGKE